MFYFEFCNQENRILNFLLKNKNSFTPVLSERVDVKEYSKKLSEKGCNIFACSERDIGHACFYLNNSKEVAFLTSICIDGAFVRKLLGHALLAEVESMAKSLGAIELHLEVSEQNKKAFKFYQKNGFNPAEKSNQKNDSVFMLKRLIS